MERRIVIYIKLRHNNIALPRDTLLTQIVQLETLS